MDNDSIQSTIKLNIKAVVFILMPESIGTMSESKTDARQFHNE